MCILTTLFFSDNREQSSPLSAQLIWEIFAQFPALYSMRLDQLIGIAGTLDSSTVLDHNPSPEEGLNEEENR
jgi:hypothetical protein